MIKIHHMTAKKRIRELIEKMTGLEQFDDMLFSNANGNLPTYEAWQAETMRLQRGLNKNMPIKPYDPQTDTRITF